MNPVHVDHGNLRDERAGVEATNSELKRTHGLGHLRVRGAPAVQLAVYLKALACNVKRMVNHFTRQRTQMNGQWQMAMART